MFQDGDESLHSILHKAINYNGFQFINEQMSAIFSGCIKVIRKLVIDVAMVDHHQILFICVFLNNLTNLNLILLDLVVVVFRIKGSFNGKSETKHFNNPCLKFMQFVTDRINPNNYQEGKDWSQR